MTNIISRQTLGNYLPSFDNLNELKQLIQSNKFIRLFNENVYIHASWPNFLKLLGISATGFTLAYLIRVWWAYRFFKSRGIKTPPYRFIVGNFPTIRAGVIIES